MFQEPGSLPWPPLEDSYDVEPPVPWRLPYVLEAFGSKVPEALIGAASTHASDKTRPRRVAIVDDMLDEI